MSDLAGSEDAKKNGAKHVSRACLECRHRHLRCDGQFPRCGRCTQQDKDCSYVKSNRGGSRKKGVKRVKLNDDQKAKGIQDINVTIPVLPCMDGYHAPKSYRGAKCPDGHDKSSCGFLKNGKMVGLPCHKKSANPPSIDSYNVNYDPKDKNYANENTESFLDQHFSISSIINTYFAGFHSAHPFLPNIAEFEEFIKLADEPKELLAVMKLIGDGFSTSIYSRDINVIFDIVVEINTFIESKPKDLISLQALILLSLLCHISALHDLSTSLRKKCIDLAFHLDINNLDAGNFKNAADINGNMLDKNEEEPSASSYPELTPGSVDEININFYNTQRIRNLDDDLLKDCARRCFWEVFFLDIIIGCSDGKTVSSLTSAKCFINFPNSPGKFEFDYETRAFTSKLVDDSVRLNNIIFSNSSIGLQYTKLSASLSNWELKFSNPDLYKLPYLVDGMGRVNNGIQQGIIMLNYAKIFTHRPLSYLWRPDIPKNLKCVELLNSQLNKEEEQFQDVPNDKDLIKSRKIIETRKTIDAANSISKTLIDTNPLDICKRTPLNACSLAFAGLVHLSSYVWYAQINQSKSQDQNLGSFSSSDLNIFEEYLKLELSGIYQISQHWYLSSKIASYLLDSITKLLPDLSKKLHSHFQNEITMANSKPKEDEFDASRTAFKTNIDKLSLEKGKQMDKDGNDSEHSTTTNTITSNNPASTTSRATTVTSDQTFTAPDINAVLNGALPASSDMSNPTGVLPGGIETPELSWPVIGGEPLSPASDTGCNWIDKNQLDFDFTNYDFGEFDFNTINAIDEMIKNATT